MNPFAPAGLDTECWGYLASGLVLATFSMKSMRRLRLIAIASNVAFIVYSQLSHLQPIFVLHCTLLPLNVLRLVQIERSLMAQRRGAYPERRDAPRVRT